MTAIYKVLRGIRDNMPSGYLLGRTAKGVGPPHLIRMSDLIRDPANGVNGGGGTPVSFANPTATASDTAVNGAASTAMRSDAAPAVQKCSSSQFGLCEVDGTSITASGGVISSVPSSGANPTATAGPAAVNGTAPTFMRSDAAPAVQKCSSSQFGLCEVDGTSILASGGVISAAGFVPLAASWHPGFIAGRYYSMPNLTSPSTSSYGTGTLFAIPFFCPATTTFTQAGFQKTDSNAANFEIGIYANSSGLPGALLHDLGSTAAVNASFNKQTGLSFTLAPGWYFLAITFSAANQTLYSIGTSTSPAGYLVGITSPAIQNSGRIEGTFVYSAGNLPNPFPSPSVSSNVFPIIVLGL